MNVVYACGSVIDKRKTKGLPVIKDKRATPPKTIENMNLHEDKCLLVEDMAADFTIKNTALSKQVGSRLVDYVSSNGKQVRCMQKPEQLQHAGYYADGSEVMKLRNTFTRSPVPGHKMKALTKEIEINIMEDGEK